MVALFRQRRMKRKKIIILDGYNVIHRVPDLKRRLDRGLAPARDALMRYCGGWMTKRKDIGAIYVVFDGDSSVRGVTHGTARGVSAVFTRTGEEADSRILDIIKRGRPDSEYIVVSDDGYVSLTSRRFGAAAMTVSEFYRPHAPGRARKEQGSDEGEKESLSPGEERDIFEELKREWGIR